MDPGRGGQWHPIGLNSVKKVDRIGYRGCEKWRTIEPGSKEIIEGGTGETWNFPDSANGESRCLMEPDNKETIGLGSGEKRLRTDLKNGEMICPRDPDNNETIDLGSGEK